MVLSKGHSTTLGALDLLTQSASLNPLYDHADTHAHIFTPPRMFSARKGANKCAGVGKDGLALPQPLAYPLRRCAAQQHMASKGAQVDLSDYGVLIGDALKERLAQKMAMVELMQSLELRDAVVFPDAAEASAIMPRKQSQSCFSLQLMQATSSFATSEFLDNTSATDTSPISLCVAKLERSALTENRDISPTDATSIAFAAAYPAEAAVKETWKRLCTELQLARKASNLRRMFFPWDRSFVPQSSCYDSCETADSGWATAMTEDDPCTMSVQNYMYNVNSMDNLMKRRVACKFHFLYAIQTEAHCIEPNTEVCRIAACTNVGTRKSIDCCAADLVCFRKASYHGKATQKLSKKPESWSDDEPDQFKFMPTEEAMAINDESESPRRGSERRVTKSNFDKSQQDFEDFAAMASTTRLFKHFRSRSCLYRSSSPRIHVTFEGCTNKNRHIKEQRVEAKDDMTFVKPRALSSPLRRLEPPGSHDDRDSRVDMRMLMRKGGRWY